MTTITAVQQAVDYATKREAARAQKRIDAERKREKARSALAEFDRLAAIRAEEIAEDQAPRHQRLPVIGAAIDPETGAALQTVVREALVDPDVKRGGYRRADPLQRMHKADPKMVTRLHLSVASMFRNDFEMGEGGGVSGGMKEYIDGKSGSDVTERRLDAMKRYRAACEAIGPTLRTPVQWLILHGVSVGEIGERLDMPEKRCSGWLLAGLDRLADYYCPDRPMRTDVAPPPFLVDAAVTDIPQDRLGRRRVA